MHIPVAALVAGGLACFALGVIIGAILFGGKFFSEERPQLLKSFRERMKGRWKGIRIMIWMMLWASFLLRLVRR